MQPIAIINRGRGPELAGTRITIYNILPYFEAGWHHSTIAMVYGISSAEVLAFKDYFELHKEEVLAENAKILARIAKGNPPEVEARLVQSKAKLQALMEELRRNRISEVSGEGHRR
jgi:uncharacterized protein (DUF433 family)